MKNRISRQFDDTPQAQEARREEARRISEVLDELLKDYQRRFPGVKIALVETPATAAC